MQSHDIPPKSKGGVARRLGWEKNGRLVMAAATISL